MSSLKHRLSAAIVAGAMCVALSGVEAVSAQSNKAEKQMDQYIETAKPTDDGTVHPKGREVEPREQWFSPCPPDKKIKQSGDCEAISSAELQGEKTDDGRELKTGEKK